MKVINKSYYNKKNKIKFKNARKIFNFFFANIKHNGKYLLKTSNKMIK